MQSVWGQAAPQLRVTQPRAVWVQTQSRGIGGQSAVKPRPSSFSCVEAGQEAALPYGVCILGVLTHGQTHVTAAQSGHTIVPSLPRRSLSFLHRHCVSPPKALGPTFHFSALHHYLCLFPHIIRVEPSGVVPMVWNLPEGLLPLGPVPLRVIKLLHAPIFVLLCRRSVLQPHPGVCVFSP